MTKNFESDRRNYTEEDFCSMSWHDCWLYAAVFPTRTFEFLLDIDYILEWVKPTPPEQNFSFWISPATLTFENVYDLEFDFDRYEGLEIESIEREDERRPLNFEFIGKECEWLWTISCHQGDIRFRSVGFKQYLRSAPILSDRSHLKLIQRGGYSFDLGKSQ